MSQTDNTLDTERIEQAKKAMEWEENREPTLLEYLRYYKNGTIGEIHIEAVIAQATKKAEVRGRIDEVEQSYNNELPRRKEERIAELKSELQESEGE